MENTLLHRLTDFPVREAVVWEGAIATLPIWIDDDTSSPFHPRTIVWGDGKQVHISQ